MIAGLLVVDPALKVMVVTKENAAAHASTESPQLPPSLEDKFGRLVGVTELEKGPASKTRLDVPLGFRNDVLRGKTVDHWLWRWLPPGMFAAIQSSCQVDEGGWTWPSMMRASSTGTLMSLRYCTGSPQRAWCLVWGSQANARGTAQE